MGKRRTLLAGALATLALISVPGPAAAQKTITLIEFRDRVADEVRHQNPGARIVLLGQTGLRVTLPGEEPKDQSLEQAYRLYREEPHRLAEYVISYARSFLPIPITAQALRVLVRTDASNPPPTGPTGDRGLTRPIAGGLLAIVALDGPDAFEFPRASRLRRELKLADAALWTRALANTQAAIPYPPKQIPAGQPARLESGKGLSSSLLVDEAFWNARVMTGQGPIVVALAGRDEIYLARLSDTELVAALREGIASAGDDVLFPRLLVRRGGRWEVLP